MSMWKGRKTSCEMQGFCLLHSIPHPKLSSLKRLFTEEEIGLSKNSMGVNFFNGTGSQELSKI